MNCPVCNVELKMSERQGIEIDYCPKCRGVWLDRGELDKIIERAAREDEADEGARGAPLSSPPRGRGGGGAPVYEPPPPPGRVAPSQPVYGEPNFPPPPASPHARGVAADAGEGEPPAGRRKKSIWRELLEF